MYIHGPTGPLTYISVGVRSHISFLFPFCNKMTVYFRTLSHRAAGALVGGVLLRTVASNAKIQAKRRNVIILIVRLYHIASWQVSN